MELYIPKSESYMYEEIMTELPPGSFLTFEGSLLVRDGVLQSLNYTPQPRSWTYEEEWLHSWTYTAGEYYDQVMYLNLKGPLFNLEATWGNKSHKFMGVTLEKAKNPIKHDLGFDNYEDFWFDFWFDYIPKLSKVASIDEDDLKYRLWLEGFYPQYK